MPRSELHSENKSHKLSIRLQQHEFEAVQEYAGGLGISVSEFVRSTILLRKLPHPVVDAQMLFYISSVAFNLNYILLDICRDESFSEKNAENMHELSRMVQVIYERVLHN